MRPFKGYPAAGTTLSTLMSLSVTNRPKASLRVDRNFKTLRELTLDKLREAIGSGHFEMGQRLVERDLCVQLDVSRTVVREALRHLESEGLVEIVPPQGATVARTTGDQARQIYEIRALLEGRAARRCAELASDTGIKKLAELNAHIQSAFRSGQHREVIVRTTAFYEALFAIADLPIAGQVVASLNARINQLRAMTISTPGRQDEAAAEMAAIIDAIRQRKAAEAEHAAVRHIDRVAELASRGFGTALR